MDDTIVRRPITVTVKTTERIIGLGHTKTCELIKTGKLKSIKVGRRRLVLFSSIEELANGK